MLGQPGAAWGCATHGAVMLGAVLPTHSSATQVAPWAEAASLNAAFASQSQHLPAELCSPDHNTPSTPAVLTSRLTISLWCFHAGCPHSYHLCANSPLCQANLFNAKLFPALFSRPYNLRGLSSQMHFSFFMFC